MNIEVPGVFRFRTETSGSQTFQVETPKNIRHLPGTQTSKYSSSTKLTTRHDCMCHIVRLAEIVCSLAIFHYYLNISFLIYGIS